MKNNKEKKNIEGEQKITYWDSISPSLRRWMMASDCNLYRKKDLIIKKYDQDLNQWHCKKIKGENIIFFYIFSCFLGYKMSKFK
jgi:hypothetical protein